MILFRVDYFWYYDTYHYYHTFLCRCYCNDNDHNPDSNYYYHCYDNHYICVATNSQPNLRKT